MIKYIWKTFVILLFFVFGFISSLFTYAAISKYQKKNRKLADITLYDMRDTLSQEALDVTFEHILEDKSINLLESQDKVIFLSFWATWCGPCIQEMPNIAQLKSYFEDKNVTFIIASYEDIDKQKKLIANKKILLDFYQYKSLTKIFDTRSLPSTYILYQGKVQFSHVGKYNYYSKGMIDLIENLLEETGQSHKEQNL